MASLWAKGISISVPGPPILPVEGIQATPPPIASRIGSAKAVVKQAFPCSYSPSVPTIQDLP